MLALLKIERTPEVVALLAQPERWQRFVEKLRAKGFFAGAEAVGTPEYEARLRVALAKFSSRASAAVAPVPAES